MTKELETLLKKMGFEKAKERSDCKKEYIKKYGTIALIDVYEIYEDKMDKDERYITFWDANITDSRFADNEMLSNAELKGKTLKEHKMDMMDLFNDLEIINQLFKDE